MSLLKLTPTDWEYAPTPSADLSDASELKTTYGDLEEWTSCTRFPTEIHDELRAAGKIADWNKGRAEHEVQWVSKLYWFFRARLDVPAEQLQSEGKAELVFEGVDTFATIYLNDKEIAKTDNHFRSWRIPIDLASLKAQNELLVVIAPPQTVANGVVATHGPFLGGSCNLGDRSRIGIRKAQHHARWDWGPELWCMGIDRPVYLYVYTSRIRSVHTAARVDADLRTSLAVDVDVEGSGQVRVIVTGPNGDMVKDERISGEAVWDLDAELWWPVNEGRQALHEVRVELYQSTQLIDTHTRKVGFRRAELVQTPLQGQEGTSFFFRINNKPIFVGGSNWIPIDMVLSTGTPERYRRWLELMVSGGQNMIRVWGGGVFEPDYFYEMCDELGLLVWQDFMFACGVYPVFPEFLKSVEAESRENIIRLRHHASLVLLCGNNEDYQQVLQWKMDQSGNPLPAAGIIYEKMLPDLVKNLTDPAIPYWPGSPYGGKGWDTADPTVGDVHQWDVWCGVEFGYHHWDQLGGRFISEFGLPALPDRRTVDYWLDGDTTQAHPQSKLIAQHNKAGSYERRFAALMNENFRMTGDLTEYIFRNQLMQSEGVGLAYRMWRREWRGPNKEYYRPKPAYYTIAHALKPISLGILRVVEKNREHDRPRQYYEYGAFQSRRVTAEVWAANSGPEHEVDFTLKAIDLMTGWESTIVSRRVTLGENRSTEVWSGELPEPDQPFDKAAPTGTVILHASITDVKGEIVRFDDWPQPYKYLDLPDPEVEISEGEGEVVVTCKKPAKGLWLDVEGENEGVVWGDNGFDVVPGEEYKVKVSGLEGKTVMYASLGWEKARLAK